MTEWFTHKHPHNNISRNNRLERDLSNTISKYLKQKLIKCSEPNIRIWKIITIGDQHNDETPLQIKATSNNVKLLSRMLVSVINSLDANADTWRFTANSLFEHAQLKFDEYFHALTDPERVRRTRYVTEFRITFERPIYRIS